MLPSLSVNQAALSPPGWVAMPSTVLSSGVSYSSNVTPRDLSSATAASMSGTSIPACVCPLRLEIEVGKTKKADPSRTSTRRLVPAASGRAFRRRSASRA
jgi:hypothetical protein